MATQWVPLLERAVRADEVVTARRRAFMSSKQFSVIIEQDEEGWYIASVPSLRGCHTQAKSLDELNTRIAEAIELCLEMDENVEQLVFIGVQQMKVPL